VARVHEAYAELGLPLIVDRLPEVFLDWSFLDVALWQWIGLLLLGLASWIVGLLLAAVFVRVLEPAAARSVTDFDDRLLALMRGPARLLVAVGAFNAGLHLLRLTLPAEHFLRGASSFLLIGGIAWGLMRLTDLAGSFLKERLTARGQQGATYLVPIGGRAIKVTIGLITVLATLATWGFDVTAVLAGLGVGGLAVALAAQKTVENVFGGVAVLLDQPVKPGDTCRFGDKVGTVEDIGLRSTRVRTLDRTVVSVPNAEFSALQIENFAQRDRIRIITTLGLRYETTPDQLRHVLAGMRRVLLAHPKVAPDPLRVRFVGFGAYSLDVELFAYVETTDFDEYLAVREDVYLRLIDVVAASGTGFAFPSSTTYQAPDRGLDAERAQQAEAEIARARAEGRLMFPDPSPEEVRALDDTLDWPPKGSAAAAAR
jgi:MscS family membrane protein